LQHLAAAQINLAYLYLNWGNPSSAVLAVRHASEAVRWARECRSAVVESQALAILAWAEALRGQPQRGYENAQQGLALAESSDYGFGRALGCFASGLTQHALGKPAEGLSSLKQASQALHQMGFPAIAERLGLELDRLEDDPKRARARLEFFKKRGLNGLVGVGLRYFPQLGQPRQEASPQPLCRLEVLGRLRFFRGGRAVALGQRAGELLAYLLLAQLGGQDEVGLLELLDTCYPNQPENESKNALHQLLHRLRNSAGSEVVLRTSAGYALGTVGSDAADFLRQGDTKLWRGELLEGQSLLVPAMVRTRLQDRLMAAALQLMPANPSEAARLGQILLRTDPYDKTALALTLSALQHTGQAKGLDQIYHHAKLQFAEVGEPLPPDPATFMQSITLP
jgi:DNA-binding SARP family transcriptional activator